MIDIPTSETLPRAVKPKHKGIHPLYKKLGGIGFIALLLYVPHAQIEALIDERMARYADASKSLADEWGPELSIAGPFFEVPCGLPLGDKAEGWRNTSTMTFAKSLTVNTKVDVSERYRGIYRANVFRADIVFEGEVSSPLVSATGSIEKCDQARALIYIRGKQASSTVASLEAAGTSVPMTLDRETDGTALFSVPIKLPANSRNSPVAFKIQVASQAAKILRVRPYASSAKMQLTSNWDTPSFIGPVRPSRIDQEQKGGFTANWSGTPSLKDPQRSLEGGLFDWDTAENGALGVEFIAAVSHYQQVTRTIKYSLLFIALTFGTLFLFEVMSKIRIHPIQYASVGFALCVFYLLLLSLSEEISFALAYLIAAVAIVSIITGYARSILGAKGRASIIGSGLSGLYGFLFFLVSSERYSLLFGAIAVFGLIATFMYVTRKVDWYRVGENWSKSVNNARPEALTNG